MQLARGLLMTQLKKRVKKCLIKSLTDESVMTVNRLRLLDFTESSLTLQSSSD
jgi:hypothetical protein